MRNWNRGLARHLRVARAVWAYLWGIEMDFLPCPLRFFFLFEPTYEELKFNSWGHITIRGFSLSLPMRNWNLPRYVVWLKSEKVWAYLWGIEIKFLFSWRTVWKGLSLPMRNWNVSPQTPSVVWVIVWAYLWGIEIRCQRRMAKSYRTVWAYLWGIEIRRFYRNFLNRFKFEPTYEELKSYDFVEDKPANWCLSLPMRNWNVYGSDSEQGKRLVWAYLWGIEIITKFDYLAQFFKFEPTYEELKLCYFY